MDLKSAILCEQIKILTCFCKFRKKKFFKLKLSVCLSGGQGIKINKT